MIAFVAMAAGLTLALPAPVDLNRLVLAIEERENGSWSNPGGRACWGRSTWVRFTTLDYRHARDPYWSRKVAKWALEAYAADLRAMGLQPTVWRLSMAWRWGDTGALRRRRVLNDYGTLTEGIYEVTP